MTGRLHRAIAARPWLAQLLLVVVGLAVAACTKSGGGTGY